MTRLTFIILMLAGISLPVFSRGDTSKYNAMTTPLKGLKPAQFRVMFPGDASTSATISWSTAEEGKKHIVHYGPANYGTKVSRYKRKAECQWNGKYSGSGGKNNAAGVYYHHCRLTKLPPKTKVYFVLESDGNFSKPMYFITAPKDGVDFSAIYGGDSRSGHSSRCQINLMMAKLLTDKPEIYAFIHGGDFIQSGKSWGQWNLWLSHHELTTTKDGRVLPILPIRGNHDGGPLYREVFDVRKGEPEYYTTNLGKDVTLINLLSSTSGDQAKWLEGELKKYRPKTKWLLTQYHKPVYPAVKGPGGQKKVFVPLFEKYNVDLACEADGHCIKRTVPIRNEKPDPTGVTYIGEGGLGVGQRTPKPSHWYLKGGITGKAHHVMLLEFKKDKLNIITILLGGKVFDNHSLSVRK